MTSENYLFDLDSLADQVPYGEIQVSLKRHNGETTKLSLSTFNSVRFTDNVQAIEHLLMAIKNAADNGQSGSLTFTVMLKSGKIDSIIEQGYESKDYGHRKAAG